MTAAPDAVIRADGPGQRRRTLYIAGLVGGGALTAVGILLWTKAHGIQGDLDRAPTRTSADVRHILDLEADGDRYALLGNVAVIGGVAVAGISGYLLWRHRRRADRAQVRLIPVVLDRGAGLALEVGGSP